MVVEHMYNKTVTKLIVQKPRMSIKRIPTNELFRASLVASCIFL